MDALSCTARLPKVALAGLILVLAVVLSPSPSAADQAATGSTTITNQEVKTAPAATSKSAVRANSISLNVSKVPFRDVLAKLAEQAHIEVVLVADTIPNDEFSDTFENLPVEAALKRVLVGKNYLARFVQDPGSDTLRVAAVYIAPEGSATEKSYRMEQVAKHADARPEAEIDADTVLLDIRLQAEDATERAAALKKYLEDAEDPDYDEVAESLRDDDAKVREVALEAMENSANLLVDATTAVAMHDEDPALRMNALRILVERTGGGAEDAIKKAMSDPDPAVQAQAKEMAELAETIDQFRAKREADRLAELAAQAAAAGK